MRNGEFKMANKSMFASMRGKLLPTASVLNAAGGKALNLSPRQKLAQLAVTGCLNGTFYASAQDQLSEVLLSLIHISEPRDQRGSRMPSSA